MTDRTRRMSGAVLGLALGLLYGLVSGYVNSMVMAGIPLQVDTHAILADAIFAGLGALAARYITAVFASLLLTASFRGQEKGRGETMPALTLAPICR